MKQVMPDYVLYRSPVGKITNRNVPLLLFTLTFVLWALGVVEGSYCTMFGSGLFVSWTYLRFYQVRLKYCMCTTVLVNKEVWNKHREKKNAFVAVCKQVHANGSKGDLADSFAFHTFFPNVLQPPIALVCGAVFAVLVRMRVCRKPIRRYDIAGGVGGAPGGGGGAISISLPGVEPSHDTERRRQIALKALSERLNKGGSSAQQEQQQQEKAALLTTSGEAAQSWPNLEEEEETETASKPPTAMAAAAPSVHVPIEQQKQQQQQQQSESSRAEEGVSDAAGTKGEDALITIDDK